jgi:Tfp pilus assembly protein PilZ
MQAKPTSRKSSRLNREGIIMLEDDLGLTPYYAVSYNRSEWGMYFKSMFEFHPGAQVFIRIDDYTMRLNRIPARVVWCKPLENKKRFRFEVGVEFLREAKDAGLKMPPPAKLQMTSRNGMERQGCD